MCRHTTATEDIFTRTSKEHGTLFAHLPSSINLYLT